MNQEESGAVLESLQFPDTMELAAERATEFRRLAPDDQWREIFGLMAFGLNMVRTSPKREIIERGWQAKEAEWQEIQRELFRGHVG